MKISKQVIREWIRLLMGKYDYKKFVRHDPDEYEKQNRESNRAAGKALGNITVISTYALLISMFLFGVLSILTVIFTTFAIVTPIMNWGLGLREELDKKGEKNLRVKAWDLKEKVRTYFFPEYDWGPLNLIPENVVKEKLLESETQMKMDLLRTGELTEEAMSKMDSDTIALRQKVQKERDKWEKALRERLNAITILDKYRKRGGEWYFYSIYPEKRVDKQCIMAFRYEIEGALDSNLKGRVTGLFRRFWARLNDVEAIVAGTVEDIILQGLNVDEVKVDLPEYVKAIKKETPVLIVVMCDADRRAACRGVLPSPPGAELLWLIRVCKALINLEPLLEELERKDKKILALEETNQAMSDDKKTGIVDWRQRQGQLYPIPDTEEEIPEYVHERVPLARRQAIVVLLIGVAIGAILLWLLLPVFGYRVIPFTSIVLSGLSGKVSHYELGKQEIS